MQHIPTVLDHGFEYIGGDIAADFANTTSNRYDPDQLHEHIQTYADLVEFARLGELIRPGFARRLIGLAERHPDKALQVYRRSAAFRHGIGRDRRAGGLAGQQGQRRNPDRRGRR